MARKMLVFFLVKIQLTKTKTIEIGLPGGGSDGGRIGDLTGIEMFAPHRQGCPAVRIYRRKGTWHLASAAMVPAPNGTLPSEWDEISNQPLWSLPRPFQASGAALAVNSDAAAFSLTSPDAVLREMANGLGAPAATSTPAPGKKKLGVHRNDPAPSPVQDGAKRPSVFPTPGVPVAENGRRFVVKPSAEDGFYLASSIPEFQALWMSRLLPEGKRPTAISLQLAESAMMSSVLVQPEFVERGGNLLAIFVRDDAIWFGGYKEGTPVLWRRCPGVGGYVAMCEAVKKTLGIDDDLVSSALEESLLDPLPALEPFLHPVLTQLELARAYLDGKHGISADRVLLAGLPKGVVHWNRLAEEALRIHLVAADPFEGLEVDRGVEVKNPHDYIVALGAALAAAEAEA